jgi:hypothetical protein
MSEHDEEEARMALGPDAWHEGEDGVYVDCPECGSPAYVMDVAETGRCTGYQGEDVDEENAEDVGGFCTAKLSFELVYREEP